MRGCHARVADVTHYLRNYTHAGMNMIGGAQFDHSPEDGSNLTLG